MPKRKEETIRLSISLPAGLLAEMDKRVISKGYASRSEFVRDLIREKMVEDRWKRSKQDVVGVLTIAYDHHQRELLGRIAEIQHHRYVNVLCSTHVHLDQHHCLEAIILKGSAGEIERIAARISGLRGVKFSRLARAAKLEL